MQDIKIDKIFCNCMYDCVWLKSNTEKNKERNIGHRGFGSK